MEFVFVIALIGAVGAVFMIFYELQKEKEQKQENQEKQTRRKQERDQKRQRWRDTTEEREKLYGKLTKSIPISSYHGDYVDVYANTQIIYIYDVKYSFKDFLSVKVKTTTINGKESYITTPDKGQLAIEKTLYGMGKSYNVKQHTQVTREPDIEKHTVYIGLKNIAKPQIAIALDEEAEIANEIESLINAIIHSNTNT
jgi:hypothetical protein